ncbi:MAG: hypothetical protein DRG27_00975, partial [Deltaproteobacteria bacterium]
QKKKWAEYIGVAMSKFTSSIYDLVKGIRAFKELASEFKELSPEVSSIISSFSNKSSVTADDIKQLRDKVYQVYRSIVDKTANVDQLANNIWLIRKEFEVIAPEFDTSKCESVVCSVKHNPAEDKLEGVEESGSKEESGGSKEEEDDDVLGLGELVKLCWKKCYEKLGKDAPPVEKFRFVWNCIREGDPVSPELVEEMKKKGYEPKAAPICVISKMVKEGLTKEQAEEECIKEGKLHPINVYAFLAKEKMGRI